MKKGDIVTITDGSYTRSVVNGKLCHELLNCGVEQDKHYVVIEIRCSFPLKSDCFCPQPNRYRNDTVIQAVDSGKVMFIHGRFLKLLRIREVTMAEICAQFGGNVKIKKN